MRIMQRSSIHVKVRNYNEKRFPSSLSTIGTWQSLCSMLNIVGKLNHLMYPLNLFMRHQTNQKSTRVVTSNQRHTRRKMRRKLRKTATFLKCLLFPLIHSIYIIAFKWSSYSKWNHWWRDASDSKFPSQVFNVFFTGFVVRSPILYLVERKVLGSEQIHFHSN